MLSSHQDITAAETQRESDTNNSANPDIAFAGLASGKFETPTSFAVDSCADRSQTPPASRAPLIPTHLSLLDREFQLDHSTNAGDYSSARIDSSPSSSLDSNIVPNASTQHPTKPIPIICTPRNPDRILTPLSGRGERQGCDYFALLRSPSPGRDAEDIRRRRRSSSSHLSRSVFKMHPEQIGTTRYTPTSPLSPRLPPAGRPVSPQPSRARTAAHRRQPSRQLQLNLGCFHPSNYRSDSQLAMESSTHTPQSSGLSYQRMPQTESPRLMRERQRELIDRARMSSRIAASPMGIKPGRPTLAPLGSPKGIVTPLELEEGHDYFQVRGTERVSPAHSPGTIVTESTKEFGEELAQKTPKPAGIR